MSQSTNWTVTIRRVGSDDWNGDSIEVGPDADGFQCVEIRYRESGGVFTSRISVPPELAPLLAKAILACAEELEAERTAEEAAK